MKHKQRGFSVVAAGVMAATVAASVAFMVGGNSIQAETMATRNKTAQLVSQAQLIRQQILACAAKYPSGNNGTGFRVPYPAAAVAAAASTLTCPGNSQSIWGSVTGVYAPTAPADFGAWQYVNDATSARLTITTTNNTAWGTAIADARTKLGTEASVSGATLTLKIMN